jgi:hypothetical protein
MAAFAALKPCRFGSVDYGKGDIIPDGVVLPERVLSLTRMGYIAQAASKSVPEVGQETTGSPPAPTQEPENGQEPQAGEMDAHPAGKKAASKK